MDLNGFLPSKDIFQCFSKVNVFIFVIVKLSRDSDVFGAVMRPRHHGNLYLEIVIQGIVNRIPIHPWGDNLTFPWELNSS